MPWLPLPLLLFIVWTVERRRKDREKKLKKKKKTTYYCCRAVEGWSFMSFEAGDVVAVIYSFHYQGLTTLLVSNRHHTDLHTLEITECLYFTRFWWARGAGHFKFSKVQFWPQGLNVNAAQGLYQRLRCRWPLETDTHTYTWPHTHTHTLDYLNLLYFSFPVLTVKCRRGGSGESGKVFSSWTCELKLGLYTPLSPQHFLLCLTLSFCVSICSTLFGLQPLFFPSDLACFSWITLSLIPLST